MTNGSEANSSGVGCLWEDEYVEELPMTFDRRKYTDPPAYLRPGLFIGSVATERDLQCLQSMGITHVLQVCTMSPINNTTAMMVLQSDILIVAMCSPFRFHMPLLARQGLVHCSSRQERTIL